MSNDAYISYHPVLAGIGLGLAAFIAIVTFTEVTPDPQGAQRPSDAAAAPVAVGMSASTVSPLAAFAGAAAVAPPAAEQQATPAVSADAVMVRPSAGVSLDTLAADHGAVVTRRPRASGYAALTVPGGAVSLRQALAKDPRVASVSPMGLIRGAGDRDDPAKRGNPHQWHLLGSRAPLPGSVDVSGVVVAVLDSGVAYEDHADAGGVYAAAGSLADNPIVAPYDFVNEDAHANDDNQHGTHIASLIASQGAVEGVAAGVALMPVKVLDSNNQGHELDLVDALHWAVDNGADVINLSLSFAPGYVPSRALQDALSEAAAAGVVLVGATGNDGEDSVSWPAASRAVIAVAASEPGQWDDSPGQSGWDKKKLRLTSYSNHGPAVDITAPGGSLGSDRTEDGVMDGIVAETIAPGHPEQTGLWMVAGSSQAAAQVSGAAAILVASGANAEQVRLALQYSAMGDGLTNDTWREGAGAGNLEVWEAHLAILVQKAEVQPTGGFYAAVLPHFKASVTEGGETCTKDKKTKQTTCVVAPSEVTELKPRALITLIDGDGVPVEEGWAMVRYSDRHGHQTLRCEILTSDGSCTVSADKYPVNDPDLPEAFAFELVGYQLDKVVHRPGKVVFATDAGELLLAAKANTPALADAYLAFSYEQGDDDPLFSHLGEGVAVMNSGTGLATSPMGLLFRTSALEANATIEDVPVDLDGTGLATSPMGFTTARLLTIDGTGLATSPMGFTSLRLAVFDGSGLATSPMGFHPAEMFGPMSGSGLATSPMGFSRDPVFLSGSFSGTSLEGSAFGSLITGSGAVTAEGHEVATQLAGSGAVTVSLTAAASASSTSDLFCALEDADKPWCD